MDFVKVRLQNFLSYHNQIFENLGTPGLTLIEGVNHDEGGANAAGKSSIWDGLSWCLFGQTVRGLKNDEVVNRKYKKECCVDAEFLHKGKHWVVSRYRKPNKLTISVDGETIEQGTLALGQEWLLEQLGIDFDLFRCTIVFAQGEMFNFVNENNKSQKEILSKVMRINFSDALLKTRALLRDKQAEVLGTRQKVDVLNSHRIDSVVEKYRTAISSWHGEKKARIKHLELELDAKSGEIVNLTKVIRPHGELKALWEKIDSAIKKYQSREALLNEKKYELKAMLGQLNKRYARLQKLQDDGKCPTCERKIGDDVVHTQCSLKNKINHTNDAYERTHKAVFELGVKIFSFKKKIERVSESVDSQENTLRTLTLLRADVLRINKQIETARTEKNPFEKLIIDEKEQQRIIAEKLKLLEKVVDATMKDIPYLQFWENAFGDSGMKSFVFDLICSSLTEKANHYANILTGGEVIIDFDTQSRLKSGALKEKFDVSLLTGGEKIEYSAYSGGEKRRISLAVDMALSDIASEYAGVKFNTIVFDEQTNYLDKDGRLAFLEMLKEIAKTKRVFVVDHDSEFKARFDDVWTIEKRGGVSRMVTC